MRNSTNCKDWNQTTFKYFYYHIFQRALLTFGVPCSMKITGSYHTEWMLIK